MDAISIMNYLHEEEFFYKLLSSFSENNTKTLNPVSVIALPHSGKTSFTKHICRKEITARYFKRTDKKLAMVLVPIVKNMTVDDFYRRLTDRAAEQTGICYPGNIHSFEECGAYLADVAARGFMVALIINKFEIMALNQNFDAGFYQNLRALSTDITPVGSVVWVTTSERPLNELIKDKSDDQISDFHSIFSNFIYLGLKNNELLQFFRNSEKERGYIIDDASIQRFIRYFGRIPGIISLAVEKILLAVERDEADYFEFCKKECNELHLHAYFEKIWNALNRDEKTILQCIRHVDGLDIQGLFNKLSIMELYGLIDRNGDDFQISSTAFSNWMKQYCKTEATCRPKQQERAGGGSKTGFEPLMENECKYILHLSDIHINPGEAPLQYTGLHTDLKCNLGSNLKISRIDYLVVSGDISSKGNEQEFAESKTLLDSIIRDFGIRQENVIIVPGNHDLNWDTSTEAYVFYPLVSKEEDRKDRGMKDQESIGEIPVKSNESVIGYLRSNQLIAGKKFENFAKFYHDIKGQPYPLDFREQAMIIKNEECKTLFLCLNSCWKMDKFHSDSRLAAGINHHALSRAVWQLGSAGDWAGWMKIVVLHHPVSGNQSVNSDFLEILAQYGFKIIFHGHIHESEHSLRFYNPWNYQMHSIGAGTFGANQKDLNFGTPWQYNLIQYDVAAKRCTVFTRKRTSPAGAWTGDAIWPVRYKEKEEVKQAFYEFTL